MKKLKVLSLCDGISCGLLALDRLCVGCEYHAVEIDKYARRISEANFEFRITRWQNDVTLVTEKDIVTNGPYDLIVFGSPCQSVSIAGNGKGLDGKSGLLMDCMKILEWCRKHNPELKFLIENVKMKKDFLLQFNELIGVEPILINSSLLSAQKRERYYWCNWKVEQPKDRGILFNDILQTKGEGAAWSKSTRYKDENGKIISTKKGSVESYVEDRTTFGKSNTLTTGDGCGSQSSKNIVSIRERESIHG
jgi:DNA (cytosine-5)-methyltransferase 3A